MPRLVDVEVAEGGLFLLRRARAQQQVFDARAQHERGKGLCHIVVRAALQALQLVELLGPRGQHHDRQAAGALARADAAQHGKAVRARHHDVQNRQFDLRMGVQQMQRLIAVRGLHDRVAVAL